MDLKRKVIILDEFIFQHEKDFAFASGELSGLLRDIAFAAKIVNREVNKAGRTVRRSMYRQRWGGAQ